MRRLLIGAALGCAILVPTAASRFETKIAAAVIQSSKTPSRSQKVNDLYSRNCARCHGPDGRGQTPMGEVFNTPDLTDPSWWKANQKISSVRSFRSIITNGKAGMPAFGKKLKKADINLLADRMQRFRAKG